MHKVTTVIAALVLAGAGLSTAACTPTEADGSKSKTRTSSRSGTSEKADSDTRTGKSGKSDISSKGDTAADCSVAWGSAEKSNSESDYRSLTNVRTGRHECYDRMVLDLARSGDGAPIGYHVRYVSTLRQSGSGEPVPVGGGAILEILAYAPSYDAQTGAPTYPAKAKAPLPGVKLAGYRTFRDARFGSSFEGQSQIGLGVRARLPFRVLQAGDRLIVDVAHGWSSAR